MIQKFAAAFFAVIILLSSFPVSLSAEGEYAGVVDRDTGHGGKDRGASQGGDDEKILTLKLASLIRDELSSDGRIKVYMTRTDDSYLSLAERGIFADSVNADILISIHFDSAGDNSAKHGVTSYTSVLDAYAEVGFGSSIASAVSSSVGMSSNGVKQVEDNEGYYWDFDRQWDVKDPSLGVLSDYYGIPTWCAKFGIKSIIVEHGFMSNPSDFQKMKQQNYLSSMASAEAAQIISHFTEHSHAYGKKSTDFPSNCTFRGKESEKCTICGHRNNITSLSPAADNHFWIDETRKEPTCGQQGYVHCICRITQNLNEKGVSVKNHEKNTVLPAPDHNYKETDRLAAGHTTDGYIQYTCKNCGNSYRETVKAEGHKYKFILKSEPTCTQAGGNLYRCTVCSDEYRDGPPALGHSFETVKSTPATCTKKGLIDKKCTRCSETEKEEIPAAGHKYIVVSETPATCLENGERSSECKTCGDKKTETLKKTSHEWHMTGYIEPACEKNGGAEFKCLNCGEISGGVLPMTGHAMATVKETESGFFTGGEKIIVCNNCGKEEVLKSKAGINSPAVIIPVCVIFISVAGTAAFLVYYLVLRKKKIAPKEEKVPETV